MPEPVSTLRHVLIWLLASLVVTASPAFAQFPIQQSFATNTATNWVLGGNASLTGSSGSSTDGWLRLTDNGGNRRGYAYYNSPFSSVLGIKLDFEYLTWGGTGADGFVVFLFDGATSSSGFQIGDFGGGLGYCAGFGGSPGGLSNAYVGIAFDEWGNFSNPGDRCQNGGPGFRPDSVVIRGPHNWNGGYRYLTGVNAPASVDCPSSVSGCASRPAPSVFYRRVIISIVPSSGGAYAITVSWQTTPGGAFTTLINNYTLPTAPPPTLKLGFAAATGGATNFHEIRNASVTLPVDLRITKTGPTTLNPQSAISYTVQAINLGPNPAAGSGLPSPVATISDAVPSLIQGVSWTCSGSGGGVCGSGGGTGNNINLTASLPLGATVTITVNGTVPLNAAGYTLPNTATITLPSSSQYSDDDPNDNTATVNTAVTGFSLSGLAFVDANTSSAWEFGEAGVAGLTQTLTGTDVNGNPVNRSVVSAANGTFTFANLPVGTFTLVGQDRSSAGFVFTTPSSLSVAVSANVINQNFGYFNGLRLSGTVFRDDGLLSATGPVYSVPANANNAVQNAPEVGVPGITVSVQPSNSGGGIGSGTVSAVTDSAGAFTMYVPNGFVNATFPNLSVRHNLPTPTGRNIGGSSIVLASSISDAVARTHTVLNAQSGQRYAGYNFAVVEASSFAPNQSAQGTSPGTVIYAHQYRPGTLGTVNLGVVGSSGYGYSLFHDADCDGAISSAERASAVTSLTVGAAWPRDPSGRLRSCAIELQVSVPAGRPTSDVDTATVTAGLTWQASSVLDAALVRDLTRLGPALGGDLNLSKRVRNVTQNLSFATSVSGRPDDVLEYCIQTRNEGTGTLTNITVRDPVPFFTMFVAGSIRLVIGASTTTLTDAIDADAGELNGNEVIVRIASLAAGATADVCYQVRIR